MLLKAAKLLGHANFKGLHLLAESLEAFLYCTLRYLVQPMSMHSVQRGSVMSNYPGVIKKKKEKFYVHPEFISTLGYFFGFFHSF